MAVFLPYLADLMAVAANWTEVCGSERLTGAMLDRLTHRIHIIEANGESYRLQQSRKRLARRQKRVAKN